MSTLPLEKVDLPPKKNVDLDRPKGRILTPCGKTGDVA
jgi:hypothetical protein